MRRGWMSLAPLVLFAGCALFREPSPEVDPAPDDQPPATESPARPPAVAKVTPKSAPTPALPPQITKPSEVEILIAEFERLRRLPAAELAREQEAARQTFNFSRTDSARMRLAVALAVPGHPSTEAALELLEPIIKNSSSPLHGLAFLMAAYIQEQRRLAAQVLGLQQNVQGLQQNVQGLQQNVQGLQQKLDALKTLERSLSEREAAAPRRR
jgi:hypothetical protein